MYKKKLILILILLILSYITLKDGNFIMFLLVIFGVAIINRIIEISEESKKRKEQKQMDEDLKRIREELENKD